jgi:hypothetical protein
LEAGVLIVSAHPQVPRDPNSLHSGTTGIGTDDQRGRAKIVGECRPHEPLISRGAGGPTCRARII